MSFVKSVYNNVFRRTSTFAFVVFAGAFMFERGFDMAATSIFENANQGKLWKHIKHQYEEAQEE